MTAKKAAKDKKKMGRPSRYSVACVTQAHKLAKLGATDVEVADFFGVTVTTITNWKHAHPDFLAALNRGKADIDARVEQSLFRRAIGYKHRAVKILTVSNGNNAGSSVEQVPYIEHYPPDTTAAIFWLKNRKPKEWRDKTNVEHSASESLEAILAGSWDR